MKAGDRDGGAARRASGATMRFTMVWKRSAPPSSGRVEAVRRRPRHPRSRSAIVWSCTQRRLVPSEDTHGGTVLATTVRPEVGTDAEILQAYQEQHITVEPGFRWIKNPAAISPVWLENPERIAALAMRTGVGVVVYAVIQQQVRLYLRDYDRQIPGTKARPPPPRRPWYFRLLRQ